MKKIGIALLFVPLLAELGERWQKVAGGVAEEHFFAVYLRNSIGARFHHRHRLDAGPRLLAACAPEEQHEIGLLLFALEAHVAGMRTVLLGADTPLLDVAIARQRSQCDAVVVSSSVDPAPSFFREELPQLVRQAGVPVFVGGSTAIRHRREVSATGAVPLGVELEDGVRLVATTLARKAPRP